MLVQLVFSVYSELKKKTKIISSTRYMQTF